jgi:hypothetical protein
MYPVYEDKYGEMLSLVLDIMVEVVDGCLVRDANVTAPTKIGSPPSRQAHIKAVERSFFGTRRW